MVFGPRVGDQRCFSEHRHKYGCIHGCAPDPVTGGHTVLLLEVIVEDTLADDVRNQRVVETIGDPSPEVSNLKEYTLLAQLIKLGISI